MYLTNKKMIFFIKKNIRILGIFLIIVVVAATIIFTKIVNKNEMQVVANSDLLTDYEIKKIELELKKIKRN